MNSQSTGKKIQLANRFHRITLATVLVSTKFYNDIYYSNSDFAKVCGISSAEINELERYCLDVLDYKLFIGEEQFSKYQQGVD